jgi:hypothetical protein
MSNLGNAQQRFGFNTKQDRKRVSPQKYKEGDKISQWTILNPEEPYKYRAQCSCGVISVLSAYDLSANRTSMCSACAAKKRKLDKREKLRKFKQITGLE